MPLARLEKFLDSKNVRYVVIRHSPAFTAMEVAEATHIPGKELAKTVMVQLDGRMVMVVVPSSEWVDLPKLAALTGAKNAILADECDFVALFPGCTVGAMPPFGNLWDVPVYCSTSLMEDEQIGFTAGSHVDVMQLDFIDFRRLVEPIILDCSTTR